MRFLVAAALLCAACVSQYTGGARSVDPQRMHEPGWTLADPTPEIRQRELQDCGAAALAMVAGRWDVTLTPSAAVPGSHPQGIRLGELRDAAREHGLTAFAIAGDRETLIHELREGRPVIVGLLLPHGSDRATSHYEVVVGVHETRGEIISIDPATGWRSRTWAALENEWSPVGHPTLVVTSKESHANR